MRYEDIDFSYLQTAVTRISGALEALTGYEVATVPTEYRAELGKKVDEPLWIIEATQVQPTDRSSDETVQNWVVLSQLIYRPVQIKADDTKYTDMYTLAPRVLGYFQSRKALVFDDTQARMSYLMPSQVLVTCEGLNAQGQAGFYITHRLPFKISIEQEG